MKIIKLNESPAFSKLNTEFSKAIENLIIYSIETKVDEKSVASFVAARIRDSISDLDPEIFEEKGMDLKTFQNIASREKLYK